MPGSKRKAVPSSGDGDSSSNMMCGRKRGRGEDEENRDANIMVNANPMSQVRR
jgi:hypothetical protein